MLCSFAQVSSMSTSTSTHAKAHQHPEATSKHRHHRFIYACRQLGSALMHQVMSLLPVHDAVAAVNVVGSGPCWLLVVAAAAAAVAAATALMLRSRLGHCKNRGP